MSENGSNARHGAGRRLARYAETAVEEEKEYEKGTREFIAREN